MTLLSSVLAVTRCQVKHIWDMIVRGQEQKHSHGKGTKIKYGTTFPLKYINEKPCFLRSCRAF